MKRIELNGKWHLTNENKDICVVAQVPGCVHTDLLSAKIIKDPFYRDNEFTEMWVCYEDWTYSKSFEVTDDILENKKVMLQCDGLDTIASIYINKKFVAETMNMHRRYAFDVKDFLSVGDNEITIVFKSVAKYAEPLSDVGTGRSPGYFSLPGSERVRKAMYQWGWDWGPKIPTAGIWRNICIKAYNEAKIDDVIISQEHVEGKVKLDFEVKVENFTDKNVNYEIDIIDPNGDSIATLKGEVLDVAKNTFTVDNPKLWYPAGFGEHPMYAIVTKTSDSEIVKSIGLRKLEVVQDKDQWGRTFYFRVNGIPIFAKGGDYIPCDQFPTRVTKEHYAMILDQTIEANMNSIRIWGGGIYEYDVFYDLCDERGILIWQDFMYACAHYPMDDPKLVEEYRLEAIDNVKRLRHHPSIAVWCGNNEMEWFFETGWPTYDKGSNQEWKDEFEKLFYHIIKDVVTTEDSARTYVPASPFSEVIFEDVNGEGSGDAHYWEVWHGRKPFTEYRKYFFRFMSEFGFESLPSMETLKEIAIPEDLNIFSRIMECHQKNLAGNELIMYYLAKNYRLPKDFRNLIYISQILHADAMRYGVEHWRRNRNDFRCMGTLYWQLNDCWQVSSWASLEYSGRWKALHYVAKEFFKPIALSIEETETNATIHLTNDTVKDFTGKVKYTISDVSGNIMLEKEIDASVKALSSNPVVTVDVSEYIQGSNKYKVFFAAQLNDDVEKYVFFVSANHMELEVPTVEVTGSDKYLIVKTDKPAFYAQIDVPDTDVRLERNFMLLMPNKEYKILIKEFDWLKAEEIAEKATVISIASTY